MSRFHFSLRRYVELMRGAIPVYDELQEAVAEATAGVRAARVLDLGAGTGETAKRALARHPAARVTAVDASAEMLDATGNAELFRRVAAVLAPAGRFVLGDVVVPESPADAVTPVAPEHDRPERVADLAGWLATAGLAPRVAWARRDLAVLSAARPG